jgi:hypothetical protein
MNLFSSTKKRVKSSTWASSNLQSACGPGHLALFFFFLLTTFGFFEKKLKQMTRFLLWKTIRRLFTWFKIVKVAKN